MRSARRGNLTREFNSANNSNCASYSVDNNAFALFSSTPSRHSNGRNHCTPTLSPLRISSAGKRAGLPDQSQVDAMLHDLAEAPSPEQQRLALNQAVSLRLKHTVAQSSTFPTSNCNQSGTQIGTRSIQGHRQNSLDKRSKSAPLGSAQSIGRAFNGPRRHPHTQLNAAERLLVVDVCSDSRPLPQKRLQCVNQHERRNITVLLRDLWMDTRVQTGDVIHIVRVCDEPYMSQFNVQHCQPHATCPHCGEKCLDDKLRQWACAHCRILDETSHALLVLHPDCLVPSTLVAGAFPCIRKAVLIHKLRSTGLPSTAALKGIMAHDLFEKLLVHASREDSDQQDKCIASIVESHSEALYGLGMKRHEAESFLHELVVHICSFSQEFLRLVNRPFRRDELGVSKCDTSQTHRHQNGTGTHTTSRNIPQHPDGTALKWGANGRRVPVRVCSTHVLDVEENIWSPTYGLKGKMDATMVVQIIEQPKRSLSVGVGQPKCVVPSLGRKVMSIVPFELKTGRPGNIEHHAQVLAYMLLISDRYDYNIRDGLLFYLSSKVPIHIAGMWNELRALMVQRNKLAFYLVQASLPPMLDDMHKCSRCYVSEMCSVLHKSLENGNVESSGMDSSFSKNTDHLTRAHCRYLAHWMHLIDLEEAASSGEQARIWTRKLSEMEQHGASIGYLVLADIEPTPTGVIYTFVRSSSMAQSHGSSSTLNLLDSSLSVKDVVVLSPHGYTDIVQTGERVRSTKYAVSVGTIQSLTPHTISVRVRKSLSLNGRNASVAQRFVSLFVRRQRRRARLKRARSIARRNARSIRRNISGHFPSDAQGSTLSDTPPGYVCIEYDCTPRHKSNEQNSQEKSGVRVVANSDEATAEGDVNAGVELEDLCTETASGDPPVALALGVQSRSDRSDLFNVDYWRVDKEKFTTSFRMMRRNLINMFVAENGDLVRRRLVVDLEVPLFGEIVPFAKRLYDTRAVTVPTRRALLAEYGTLNVDQRRAVDHVLTAGDYALLLGMPGTGKSTTIVFLVRTMVALGYSVLLSSYTNAAVDNLLLKLVEHGVDFLRIGRTSAIHAALHAYTLQRGSAGGAGGGEFWSGAHGISPVSIEDLENLVMSKPVVGTTCLQITHPLFSKRRFDFCIVDEASQITQPVCIGPIRCADKFVLVGDHYQLPPLVISPEALEQGMSISLFKRLSQAHPSTVVNLTFQYRMNHDIMQLSNTLAYNHRLRVGSPAIGNGQLTLYRHHSRNRNRTRTRTRTRTRKRKRKRKRNQQMTNRQASVTTEADDDECSAETESATVYQHACEDVKCDCVVSRSEMARMLDAAELPSWLGTVLEPRRRVVFVDTDTFDARELYNGSAVRNSGEVLLVKQLVAALVNVARVDPATIGVISPYRSQIKSLQHALGDECFSGVEIHTVDRFQGRDKDVIIISFVRSNDAGNVGDLLRDWRRLNVAFSRAKKKLVMFGSVRTLQHGYLFKHIFRVIRLNMWMLDSHTI